MRVFFQGMMIWLLCGAVFSMAEESEQRPATVTMLSLAVEGEVITAEVEGFPEVKLRPERPVGPVGIRPGKHSVRFVKAGGKPIVRRVDLGENEGRLFIVSPRSNSKDGSEISVYETRSLNRDDLGDGANTRVLRIINGSAEELTIEVEGKRHSVAAKKEVMHATSSLQLRPSCDGKLLEGIDFRDLRAATLVVFGAQEAGLRAVVLPSHLPHDSEE